MEKPTEAQTLTRHTMAIGAYTGCAYVFIYLVFYLSNVLFSPFSEYLTYLISIAAIYYGVSQYKAQTPNNHISYGTSLKAGFLIVFWGSLILAFFMFLLIQYFDPSLRDSYLNYFEDYLLQSSSYSEEQISMLLDFYRTFLTPSVIGFMELVGKSFMGFIFSLIISIFIIRKNNTAK